MSRTPPKPPGPPGLQYPHLPSDISPAIADAMRNIFDNLFYIRGQVSQSSTLSAAELAQINRLIAQQINNFFNNVTNNITNNFNISGCIVGSHNLRITVYGAASQPLGTMFYETDRHVFYVICSGPQRWQFGAGVSVGVESNLWGDLGVYDAGFLYFATDTSTLWIWDGTTWIEAGGGSTGICYIPMTTGAEPFEIMGIGGGHFMIVAIDVPQ